MQQDAQVQRRADADASCSSTFQREVLPIVEAIRNERGLWMVFQLGESRGDRRGASPGSTSRPKSSSGSMRQSRRTSRTGALSVRAPARSIRVADANPARPRAPDVPLSVGARGRRDPPRARPRHRRRQERHGQRRVLSGTLSGHAAHAGRADDRVADAGRHAAAVRRRRLGRPAARGCAASTTRSSAARSCPAIASSSKSRWAGAGAAWSAPRRSRPSAGQRRRRSRAGHRGRRPAAAVSRARSSEAERPRPVEVLIHDTAIVHPERAGRRGHDDRPVRDDRRARHDWQHCRIGASSVVDGWTEIGDHTQIAPLASIGLAPQDLKYQRRADAARHRPAQRVPRVRDDPPRDGGRRRRDDHRRSQPVHGLRARRARLPRRQPHDLRQRRDARRPRHGRGLRDDQRLFGRAPVLPRRPACVHRRLHGRHARRAAVCEDRRQPRAHLRRQLDRPRAARLQPGADRQAAARLPPPAAAQHQPRARADRTRPLARRARSHATSSTSSSPPSAASSCGGRPSAVDDLVDVE